MVVVFERHLKVKAGELGHVPGFWGARPVELCLSLGAVLSEHPPACRRCGGWTG